MSLHQFHHAGSKIVLIDTPGFDDTFLSDADILQDVAACLELTYNNNLKLTGIIYMHRIIDPRMTHGGMSNLAMFRKLCGSDPMPNVILATSFWGKVTQEEGLEREEQLRTNPDFWAEMIEDGAQIARFENSRESGLALIETLIGKDRISLRIQKEMCEDGIPLAQTQAGEHVNAELAELARKHAEEMTRLQQELQDALKAADEKLEKTVKRELSKSEKKLQRLYEQQEALKAERRNEKRAVDQELDRWKRRVEAGIKVETESCLKANLAEARREDRLNKIQQQKERKHNDRKKVAIKCLKIGGNTTCLALSVAGCVVNPLLAPMLVGPALSSFLSLLNLVFDSRSSSMAAGEGVDDVNGGGRFIDDFEGVVDVVEVDYAEDDEGVDCS